MRRFLAGALLTAVLLGARGMGAQVGHTPEQSPYIDLIYRHEITTFSGYLDTRRDPAGVAPRSAPLVGVRYALWLAGPASFTARVAYGRTERRVLDPLEPVDDRVVIPAANVSLLLADAGVALSLTGFKSWNRLVPEVNGGVGLVSDFRTKADVGGFSFGTRFALTLGAGVRYVPGGRFQLRVDLTDNLYRIAYPDSYFGAAIVDPDQPKAIWTHNPSLTLGVSYLFGR